MHVVDAIVLGNWNFTASCIEVGIFSDLYLQKERIMREIMVTSYDVLSFYVPAPDNHVAALLVHLPSSPVALSTVGSND